MLKTAMLNSQIIDVATTLYNKHRTNQNGNPASYIPELETVNPDLFSISIVDVKGQKFNIGNTEAVFTLQSTSKPFVYALAASLNGIESIHQRVGVEPTGEAFNSIIELEEKNHRPFNPMINSGAIATASLISGSSYSEKIKTIDDFFAKIFNKKLIINEKVFQSEKQTAHRNRAIAYLMKHFSVMNADVEETLDLYFKQCSYEVTTDQLAFAAALFSNHGRSFSNQNQIIPANVVTKTLSLMLTCGMYDSAGEWVFDVGLPAKSGVSGALFACVPNRFGLAVFSPRIDQHGHSVRALEFIKDFSKQLNLHIFG